MRASLRLASVAILSVSFAACGNSTSSMDASVGPPDLGPPPKVCKTPGAPAEPWFVEVTATVLPMAADPTTAPTTNTIQSGDLDGDGYPDLITTGGMGFPARVPATTCGDGLPTGKACTKAADCGGDPCTGVDMSQRDGKGMRTRHVWMNRPDPNDPSGKARVFVDATEDSHILDTRDGVGGFAFALVSIGDIDNDGDEDLVLGPSTGNPHNSAGSTDPGAVKLNDGMGHFQFAPSGDLENNVTGFGPSTAALFDFDADGVLDWIPGTFVYPPPNILPPMLLQGKGGGMFTEVTAKYGFPSSQGDCGQAVGMAPPCAPMYGLTTCDLDMDGDQDILFASYGREPNQVWRNDGDHFTEIGVPTGIAYDDRMDYSDDQSYRCYCQNRPGKCDPQPPDPVPGICTAFGMGLTDGRGWYPGISDQPWNLGGNNYSLVCADVDNDGDMDIMTSTIRHGDVGSASDPSELVVNNTPVGMPLTKFARPGGKATGIDRSAGENGINWNEGDLTAQMVDLDNDGLKDVYLCSSDYPGDHGWFFHQKADHTFEDLSKPTNLAQTEAHGIAFFDYDKDGDLDVAIGTSTFRGGAKYALLRIYENKVGQDQNWVQFKLVGKGQGGTNRSAIGALIKVTAGGVTQQMEVPAGHSASGTQNEHVVTFGLGASCAIDKVEVRWLDGKKTVSTFTGVLPNYRVRITEGASAVEYIR